jgi:hypothetical protein
MIPGVSVSLSNGNIGGPANTSDGVVGQVITGAGTGAIALLQPCKFVSLTDAESQGLTATAEPEANQFVTDFYNDAPIGSVLYLMLAPNTSTIQSLCDVTNASGAKKLLDFAVGNAGGQIRVIGISRTPATGYTPATDEFIDSDAVAAGTNAQALSAAYFAQHTPVRVLIGARVADASSATVFSPNSANQNGVAYSIGGVTTDPYGSVGMGTILARVAATQPQVNIGRVKDGPLSIGSWYIGALPSTPPASGGSWYQQLNTLINAGYITCTTYPNSNKAGYYVSDDPMATSDTDDFESLANCRVIDKASIISYQAFLNYVNSEVELQTGGTMDPADIADIQSQIVNALAQGLAGNISGTPACYINPAQVFTAGTPFQAQIRVIPFGYLKQIEVNLGFSF